MVLKITSYQELAYFLIYNLREIERVLYFESYIVTDPGLTPLEKGQLLTEEDVLKSI